MPLRALLIPLLLHEDHDTVGKACCVLVIFQMVPFLAVLPATELALKSEFDDFGRKR